MPHKGNPFFQVKKLLRLLSFKRNIKVKPYLKKNFFFTKTENLKVKALKYIKNFRGTNSSSAFASPSRYFLREKELNFVIVLKLNLGHFPNDFLVNNWLEAKGG